jgi:hypothetical protein
MLTIRGTPDTWISDHLSQNHHEIVPSKTMGYLNRRKSAIFRHSFNFSIFHKTGEIKQNAVQNESL